MGCNLVQIVDVPPARGPDSCYQTSGTIFYPIPVGLIFDYFMWGGGPLKSALIELEKLKNNFGDITYIQNAQKCHQLD